MQAKKETIIGTIITFIALVNIVLTAAGKNPLPWSETELYAGLSGVASVAATIWSWWMNNSFTKEAIQADEYMEELKAKNITD